MHKESYNVIGVMSGTSLDGIDLASITIDFKNGRWSFEIGVCETIAYSPEWQKILATASTLPIAELHELNIKYTKLLGTVIHSFIEKHSLAPDAVCSHGHTILHQPQSGITLQIGNLPELASLINQTIVCDFRVQDVKMGGQGAPLVPIGDRLLFAQYDYCMNLGGFSNVSFEDAGSRIAFDISPVNTVLNHYANTLGMAFDHSGATAASGEINEELLHLLNMLDYYKKSYPKSLGIEYVNDHVLPMLENSTLSTVDKMRTFTEHIALQTALALPSKNGRMLITGGGAYNTFLIERIAFYLPKMELVIPDNKLVEYKEALIFALLGVLRLRGEINVLSSVTGATADHSSGNIFYP